MSLKCLVICVLRLEEVIWIYFRFSGTVYLLLMMTLPHCTWLDQSFSVIMGTVLCCRVVACNLEIKVASREYKGKKLHVEGIVKTPMSLQR